MPKSKQSKDFVITYSSGLKQPYVLPKGFENKFIRLTEEMIHYFTKKKLYKKILHNINKTLEKSKNKSKKELMRIKQELSFNLPHIHHFSGLVKEIKAPKNSRKWKRDYYLIENYYIDEDWRRLLVKNMKKVNRTLGKYKNKLSWKKISEFYHSIEVSCYCMGYKIDEITIEVKAGNCMKGNYWYPSINIETRSIDGHKGECELVCKQFSRLIKKLFPVSHLSKRYSIEVY